MPSSATTRSSATRPEFCQLPLPAAVPQMIGRRPYPLQNPALSQGQGSYAHSGNRLPLPPELLNQPEKTAVIGFLIEAVLLKAPRHCQRGKALR